MNPALPRWGLESLTSETRALAKQHCEDNGVVRLRVARNRGLRYIYPVARPPTIQGNACFGNAKTLRDGVL